MGRLQRRIGQIAKRNPKHWRGAVWHWAAKRTPRVQLHRFRAYRDWAHKHWRYARDHKQARNRVHAYWVVWRAARKHYRWRKRHMPKPDPPKSSTGFLSFDAHQVPAWMVQEALAPARASGVWKGVVFSGYRTPEYSRSLCQNMCGQDTCPGRCAGVYSNHAKGPEKYLGAVDVSDPAGLQYWCASHGFPIRHTLPYDAPHFSRDGQ